MGATHRVVTVPRQSGYLARCEDCDAITFGGFESRSTAREALAGHESAPAESGNSREGENTAHQGIGKTMSEYQPTDGTVIEREPEGGWPNARTISVDVTDAELSPAEVSWAAEHLSGLEVLIRDADERVRVWECEGKWFRDAGHIIVHTCRDGEQRFIIRLAEAATEEDLEWFERRVQRAREGYFLRFGWQEHRSRDTGAVWWEYSYDRQCTAPSPEDALAHRIEPCRDSRCIETYHRAGDALHVAEELPYARVTRWEGLLGEGMEADPLYEVEVELEAEFSPERLAGVISDLEWAKRTCEKVNAAEPEPVTKGITNAAEYWRKRRELEALLDRDS